MSKEKVNETAKNLWGIAAAHRFIRFPFELLAHYKDINLNDSELPIMLWLVFHQWGEKASFAHPRKLAAMLHITESEAVDRLKELEMRGFITLEETRNNSRNYHQDIRPTRNRLRQFLEENPDHCKVYNEKHDPRGIDVSVKNSSSLIDKSTSIDTSILHGKSNRGETSSINDVINKRSKKR